jgi:hypothetical protein
MPFTPFHFGPSFLIGMLFASHLNMAAILLASVAIDIEPIYCLVTNSCPLHGILHTYLGATGLSLFVTPVIYLGKKPLQRLSELLGIVFRELEAVCYVKKEWNGSRLDAPLAIL